MGLPAIEQVSVAVLNSLSSITTANGYTNNLTISRSTVKNVPAHLNGFIFQFSPEQISSESGYIDWWAIYGVILYVLPTEDDTTPLDTYNNAAAADIVKAIQKDYTQGGVCLNTETLPVLYMTPVDGDYSGIIVNFQCHYRCLLDDPYTLAT